MSNQFILRPLDPFFSSKHSRSMFLLNNKYNFVGAQWTHRKEKKNLIRPVLHNAQETSTNIPILLLPINGNK
jgi:hypothetical protein